MLTERTSDGRWLQKAPNRNWRIIVWVIVVEFRQNHSNASMIPYLSQINKDGVIREESEEEAAFSEEESRSEAPKKEKGRAPKAQTRALKNRPTPPNRER